MILYGSSMSPFVRKCLVVAAEKGVEVTLVPAGMGRGGPEFAEASPFGKMPALRHVGANGGSDYCLADSSAIAAYIDALHPDPSLIPAAPMARGKTIWWDEFVDTILFAAASKVFFNRFVSPMVLKQPGNEDVVAHALAFELPPLFDYLESQIPDSGFLVEDRFTLADIAVASPFVNLGHVDVLIDAVHNPKTAAYVAGILARPSFAPIVAAERAMIAKMTEAVPALA